MSVAVAVIVTVAGALKSVPSVGEVMKTVGALFESMSASFAKSRKFTIWSGYRSAGMPGPVASQ